MVFLTATAALLLAASGIAQSLPSLAPPASALQHVTVVARTLELRVSDRGGATTLWADVTPKRGVHVYASGAKDFTAVSLVMTPRSGVTFEKPGYPASEPFLTLGSTTPVPVYRTTFRITQPIRLGRMPADAREVVVAGALNYQACDDTTCYPPASLPVLWRLPVRGQ